MHNLPSNISLYISKSLQQSKFLDQSYALAIICLDFLLKVKYILINSLTACWCGFLILLTGKDKWQDDTTHSICTPKVECLNVYFISKYIFYKIQLNPFDNAISGVFTLGALWATVYSEQVQQLSQPLSSRTCTCNTMKG